MTHPESITIRCVPASGRRTVAVNGAYATTMPGGNEMVVHLYMEYPSVPLVATQRLDAEGNPVSGTGEAVAGAEATREIQTSLVLSPETAVVLGEFLQREGQRTLSRCGGRERSRSEGT